jgi:endoglucanase
LSEPENSRARQVKRKKFLPFTFYLLSSIASLLSLAGCLSSSSVEQPELPPPKSPIATVSPVTISPLKPVSTVNMELIQQSWIAYRQRFIQADGRVIDREDSDRSTSEAQAYALLRAVFMNDPTTFAKTLEWAENNLQRKATGNRVDRLWVWKWGRDPKGNWGIIDRNFASDADIDAITALILASRRWKRPEYLSLARAKLQNLWNLSTVAVPGGGSRYLLPGPREAFQIQPTTLQLNPSYLAPYAFRLFAQVDPAHNWLSLVDSSYEVLENSSALSAVGLPSNWVSLDTQTGQFQALPASGPLPTEYSFDAYRVWWRVALDATWFKEPLATSFMRQHLRHLQKLWRTSSRIPARIDLQGQPLVDYEATSQYAMLYAALRLLDPVAAEEILQRKLMPQYRKGFWDNDSAYYTQNLVWLGLLPPTTISSQLLQPN